MSHPSPTAADLIEEASLPCHHRREPFGPCETCLEDVVHHATDGLFLIHEEDLNGLRSDHATELTERDDRETGIERERDDALESGRALVKKIREVVEKSSNSAKIYLIEQLNLIADNASDEF